MAFKFVMKVDDKQLMKKLKELENNAMRRVFSKAMRAGLKVAERAIRAQAKQKSVKAAIGSKVRLAPSKGRMVAKVGVNVGKKPLSKGQVVSFYKQNKKGNQVLVRSTRFQVPHAIWVVLGTKARWTKAGRYTGIMPSDNIVRRGWAASKQAAYVKMNETMRMELLKEWGKQT